MLIQTKLVDKIIKSTDRENCHCYTEPAHECLRMEKIIRGILHHQLAVMWKEPGDQNPIATFSHL